MNWSGWEWDRVLILFVSLAFLMIAVQVTMYHYRQNFHKKAMWIPVIAAPLFFIVGLSLTFYNVSWLASLFLFLMWLGLIDGLIGFIYHVKGVGSRVGGWKLRNFLIGPPIMMPLMFSALSVLGLIIMYWR
ncbi:hypothetical protein [Mechercharimyces sp. CAU 1602]|uniref:hypothetical protein n=1 Tax=Mechercharimyces sp. CAU 1602 TaxID=2973933 RepID=UPI0021620469|nr:hypothetical protein [Mechercharimyces sp. CAU 1602]MCS1352157.1 hypothetical protein [Mechercharimyces sp. CAU 1602]